MIVIKRITTQDAPFFRDVRLRALEESPTSFSSTYVKESQFSDDEWIKRAIRWSSDDGIGFLAYDGDRACGMVFCYTEQDDQGHIVSMWVDPEFRRAGVGRLLVDSVVTWAKGRGMRELMLMVTSVNHGAITFYERIGFRMTGVTGPYPNDPGITEYQMALVMS
jgi:ribosomal protein S18 acetylase RimI-like enzyme